jgi:hypothetical protein
MKGNDEEKKERVKRRKLRVRGIKSGTREE